MSNTLTDLVTLWLLASITITSITVSAIYPVILIPGDLGSRIDAKLDKPSVEHHICEKKTDDYKNIWLNLEMLVPYLIKCLADNLKLIYDNVSRTTHNPPGVETIIPGWGDCSVVENIDPNLSEYGAYFNSIADALVSAGLERGVSIRGAPYDFRKGPNEHQEFFANLKLLTEETYAQNNNRPVVIIAHSMGGCMAVTFLRSQTQEWKDQYVRALVALASPWGGTVKALKVFAVGDDLGVEMISSKVLKEAQITSPSLAWLLPSPNFWKPEEILVQTDVQNYTVADYRTFFEVLEYMNGYEMYLDVKNFTEFESSGVEVHCLHGNLVPTLEIMKFKPGRFKDPKMDYGDGDGTINIRSLLGCTQWATTQTQEVYHQVFSNTDHMKILREQRVLDYIVQLIGKP